MRTIALIMLAAVAVSGIKIEDVKKDKVDHSTEFFPPWMHSDDGNSGYTRKLPEHFNGEGPNDDRFMHNMIKNFALEGKNKDGSPNGKFWMDRAAARIIGTEVLQNNIGMKPADIPKYLDENFEKTWNHFDLYSFGKLEVSFMPMFMKVLAGQPYIDGLHA